MTKSERLATIPKALGITVLAFILSMFFAVPFNAITTAVIKSPEENDFRMTDLYAQLADHRGVKKYDDRIILVDIGIGGRTDIATLLNEINEAAPKAVGLDVNFQDPGDEGDQLLMDAVAMTDNLVLAQTVAVDTVAVDKDLFKIESRPFFDRMLDGLNYGVVTWPSDSPDSRIREYRVDFPAVGDTLTSFSAALAELYAPGSIAAFRSHNEQFGIIDFPSRGFPVIPAGELADRLTELTGKIVIVGAMNDFDDTHGTPVASRMPGMQIHAHITANLLDKAWPIDITHPADDYLAIALCLLMVIVSLNLEGSYKGIIMRCLQVSCAYMAVRIGYTLYVDHNIICGLTRTLLMITFGMFAIDVWKGLWNMGSHMYVKILKK